MDFGLRGKRALVTGSTAGIGFATARALANEGAHVTLNGRTEARVSDAVERIRRELADATVDGIAADLSSGDGCRALIGHLTEVDVLVNNLGIFEPKPFEQIPDEDWIRFFEINVLSGIRLARHYVRGMRSRNWGRIVFVSSESGLQIPTEMIHYGVTKTAQLAVSRGLAETLAGTGVTVNIACFRDRPLPRAWANSSPKWPRRAAWMPRRWNGNSSRPLALPRFCSDSPPPTR